MLAMFVPVSLAGMTGGASLSAAEGGGAGNVSGEGGFGPSAGSGFGPKGYPVALFSFLNSFHFFSVF
jgi:hypothetical protein